MNRIVRMRLMMNVNVVAVGVVPPGLEHASGIRSQHPDRVAQNEYNGGRTEPEPG